MFLLTIALLMGAGDASVAPDAAYLASYARWKAELVQDLRTNWLPLAGLFWLDAGTHSFGCAPSNDIVLPEGTGPARAGAFERSGGDVTVRAAPGVRITTGGKPVTGARLNPDAGGKPTVLELGRLRLHGIRRGERVGIRVRDLDSPALRDFKPLVFYPVDLRYRVTARWVSSDGKTTVDVPNVLGDVTATPVPGEVRFRLGGKECTLMALGGSAAEGLFFVFSDATRGTRTYPPGRFLDTGPVANGTVVLDFNRAYNPPCAVTPYATCPLPPPPNRLGVAIPAGEQYRREGH